MPKMQSQSGRAGTGFVCELCLIPLDPPSSHSHLPSSWLTERLNYKGQKHAQTLKIAVRWQNNYFYASFLDTKFPSLPCSERRQGDQFGPLRCARKSAVSFKEKFLVFPEQSPMPLGAGTWSTNSLLHSVPAFPRSLVRGETPDHRCVAFTRYVPLLGFMMSLDYSWL